MASAADAAAAASASGVAQNQADDVDWSSVEQVSQLVSRTTLSAMQQLWRQHATGMDELGRAYAGRMYDTHSQAVRDIAEVKTFDLKRVLQLLNNFTEVTRELVLGVMQEIKRRDDDFTQQLYQTTRGAFARNLRAALEVRDAWYREKLRGLRQRHDAQLAAVRHAAAVELQQRQMQLKIALARTLAKSARQEHPNFALGMLGARAGAEASGATLPSAATGTGSVPPGPVTAPTCDGSPTGVGGGAGAGAAGSTSVGHCADTAAAVRSSAAALSLVAAAASSVQGAGLGDGNTSGGGGVAMQELGPEAAMLEELFEDANAADALNRELEASLARANTELLEMKEKLEAAQASAQDAAADAAQWRSKWVVESTKTDSIKRESMAIIAKCEEHLTQLQQHHIAEISQRDYLLQRCRDTITALESRLAAASDAQTLSYATPTPP